MTIQWLGRSCFKILTKNGTDEVTIAIDPFTDNKDGLKMPKFGADILLMTHDHTDHNNADAIRGEPFVVTTPGEFEFKGVFIYGIPSFHDDKDGKERGKNIIYKVISEEISFVHLGDLGHELTAEQVERLGNVDILAIPVGGIYTIDAAKANKIIAQVEPRFVIPMHYQNATDKKPELKTVDEFLKTCGLPQEKQEKFKVGKKDVAAQVESTKVIVLSD